jgi:hypothetical protein
MGSRDVLLEREPSSARLDETQGAQLTADDAELFGALQNAIGSPNELSTGPQFPAQCFRSHCSAVTGLFVIKV